MTVQMLKREWGVESNGKKPYLSIPIKTAVWVPEFAVEDLWTELRPWLLILQRRTCHWAEYSDDDFKIQQNSVPISLKKEKWYFEPNTMLREPTSEISRKSSKNSFFFFVFVIINNFRHCSFIFLNHFLYSGQKIAITW